ncbi:hypothetical protein Ancab_003910 [Ancistrocladus abbreviatus]
MSKSNGRKTKTVLPLILFFFSISPSIFSSMPIVVSGSSIDVFHRRDPLRKFEFYNGGYDLKDKHYWASVAFTGIHGYAVAGVWLLFGLGFGIFLIVKTIKRGRSSNVMEHSNSSYYMVFLMVVLLTLLAITATGLVIASNQHSLQQTKTLKSTIFGTGAVARRKIHRVNKAMKDMLVYLCPYDQHTCLLLNKTSNALGDESHTIQQFVHKYGHSIDIAIWIVYLINLVIVTANLVFLVAVLVLLLLHWQPGFLIIIFFFWILATACWVLTGIDFFLHNFAEDTCAALQNFLEKPGNNSLSSILPCGSMLKAESVLTDIGRTIHNFIAEIMELPKQLEYLRENDNAVRFRTICDPFSGAPNYSFIPGRCPKDAIPIGKIPDILARFNCYGDNNNRDLCRGRLKILPQSAFVIAYAYSRSVQDLINVYPDLESLIHCSFVKDRISDAELNLCRPFKVSTRLLWSSMISLSIIMVILVVICVMKASQDRGRCFSKCSIIPNPRQA